MDFGICADFFQACRNRPTPILTEILKTRRTGFLLNDSFALCH